MAELFVPDNHAPDFPEYAPVPEDAAERMRGWLLRHYGGVFSGREAVLGLAGANINSNNFRVGNHYVKALKLRPGMDYVASFPEISTRLLSSGVPCAEFMPNSENASISRIEDGSGTHFLYVQRFIDAHYFRGSAREIDAVLPLLARMSGALASLRPTAGQREPYTSMDLGDTLDAVSGALPPRSADPFDLNAAAVLPELREIAAEFDSVRAQMELSRLHHFDLHPHNLLLKGGHVAAILDLESFRALPFDVSVAFALFKLGRKAVASRNLTAAEFRERAAVRFDVGRLARYARFELARRITAVVCLHYLQGNRDWDQDLVKHLRGLREVDQLLGPG